MIKNYLKTAIRNILRYKAFAFINIFGLSIGLACVLLVASYINNEYNYDSFQSNKGKLYRLIKIIDGGNGEHFFSSGSNLPQGPSFKEDIPEIQSYCRIAKKDVVLQTDKGLFSDKITYVDSSFADMFSIEVLKGNPNKILQDPNTITLTEDEAIKYFGSTDIIGKTVEIGSGGKLAPFIVEAVIKNMPAQSSIQFGILNSLKTFEKYDPDADDWGSNYLETYLLLNKPADYSAIDAKLKSAYYKYANYNTATPAEKVNSLQKTRYSLQPLSDVHLNKEVARRFPDVSFTSKDQITLLTKISLLVLFLASTNFVTLSLASSLRRKREIGIRKVIGGKRSQIFFQFLSESFVLTFLSAPLALLLAKLMSPYLTSFLNIHSTIPIILDPNFIIIAIVILCCTALLAGVYPAVILSGFETLKILYNRTAFASKNYLTRSLIALQFAVSIFFIASAIGLGKQYNLLMKQDLGYNKDDVLTMNIGMSDFSKNTELKTTLATIPQIKSSTFTNWDYGLISDFSLNGNRELESQFQFVDHDFLDVFSIKLLQGRNFYDESAIDSSTCIVSQSFLKQTGIQTPLEQQISFRNKKYTIVGVINDYQYATLKTTLKPIVLFKRKPQQYGQFYIKCEPGQSQKVRSLLPSVTKTFDPTAIPVIDDLAHKLSIQYDEERRMRSIANFAALICILLCCTGLYGLVSLALQYRVKEIGIRKVLGASATNIIFMIAKNFVFLVIIGLLIASPFAWYFIHSWLQKFAYRVNISLWLFLSAGGAAVLIALCTIGFQIIKTSLANPVKSLRTE